MHHTENVILVEEYKEGEFAEKWGVHFNGTADFIRGELAFACRTLLKTGLVCNDDGGLLDGAIKESYGHTHVHEGGLFVIKIAQDIKWDEKIKKAIAIRGGVDNYGPK